MLCMRLIMAKKTITEDLQFFYEYGIYVPTRTIYMGSESEDQDGAENGVDFLMAERAIKGLHILESQAPNGDKPITILMNNPGGQVDHGCAMYDSIKSCKNHVTIKVVGNAQSMAGYILQAADKRILSPNSTFMFHIGTVGYASQHPKIIDKWVAYNRNIDDKLDSILLSAINNKRKKDDKKLMTKAQFDKLNDFDTILSADDAVEWGLADLVE